jgi:hypothetical protein
MRNNFKKILLIMNVNLLGQLLSIFFIVTSGPAVIAYLAYKKAL